MLQQVFQSLEDFKVQSKNGLKVLTKTNDDVLRGLQEQLRQSQQTVHQLHKKCDQLEDTVKQLKRDVRALNNRSEATSMHPSQQGSSIRTVLNKGRYANNPGSTNDLPKLTSTNCSESSAQSLEEAPHASGNTSCSNEDLIKDISKSSTGLRIPLSCSGLLLGDSNLKNVSQKRLSPSRSSQVRTYRGATIPQMSDLMQGTQKTDRVKRVILSVGTNDIGQGDSVDTIVDNYSSLLHNASCSFPGASIAVAAIPPQSQPGKNRLIRVVNRRLGELCDQQNVCFLSQVSIWECVHGDNLSQESNILSDKIHLSEKGLGLYLREVKDFLFPSRRRKAAQHGAKLDSENESKGQRDSKRYSGGPGSRDRNVLSRNQPLDMNQQDNNRPSTISGTCSRAHETDFLAQSTDFSRQAAVSHLPVSPHASSAMHHHDMTIPHHLPVTQQQINRRWPVCFPHTPYYPNPFISSAMPPPYPYPPAWYHGYPPQRVGHNNMG